MDLNCNGCSNQNGKRKRKAKRASLPAVGQCSHWGRGGIEKLSQVLIALSGDHKTKQIL